MVLLCLLSEKLRVMLNKCRSFYTKSLHTIVHKFRPDPPSATQLLMSIGLCVFIFNPGKIEASPRSSVYVLVGKKFSLVREYIPEEQTHHVQTLGMTLAYMLKFILHISQNLTYGFTQSLVDFFG